MLVLSQTFDLESFDSYHDDTAAGLGQRQSILDVVPIDRKNEGRVIYQPSTLNWISIRNKDNNWLRNLKFRMVDGTYTPIELYGQASIVLLVKNFDE